MYIDDIRVTGRPRTVSIPRVNRNSGATDVNSRSPTGPSRPPRAHDDPYPSEELPAPACQPENLHPPVAARPGRGPKEECAGPL